MTEEEENEGEWSREDWAESDNPEVMLEFIDREASERKLRLFGCACCRRIWPYLSESQQNAIIYAELFADALVLPESLNEITQLWLQKKRYTGQFAYKRCRSYCYTPSRTG